MANEQIGAKIELVGADKASSQLQQLQKDVDGFNKNLRKNNDAVRLLDQLTGGAVTKFRTFGSGISQASKSLTGFNKGLGLTKKALIATGIGAFVVLLGTVIAYWDEIVEFITGAAKAQQELNDAADRTIDLLDASLGIIEQQIKLGEIRGEDTKELVLELRKELLIQQAILDKEIERREEQLKLQQEKDKELTWVEKLKVGAKFLYDRQGALVDIIKFQNDESEETIKKQNELNGLKSKTLTIDQKIASLDKEEVKRKQAIIDDVEQKKLDAKKAELAEIKKLNKLEEDVDKALVVTKEDKRQAELQAIRKYYEDLNFELLMAGELDADTELALNEAKRQKLKDQQLVFDEEDLAEKDKENEEFEVERLKKISDAEAELEAVRDLEDKKQKFAQDTLDNLSRIAGEETKLGKALLLAKQLLAAKQFLIDIGALKATASIQAAETNLKVAGAGVDAKRGAIKTAASQPFPANIPLILGYVATAASIISGIVSAASASKTAISAAGGSAGATPTVEPTPTPSAPAFNIVGQTETSQLAETITGQSQEPIQAFVVSNDVTTAQSLQRNIVEGATI